MSKVTLVCKTPGFRRMGIAHPATETYPLDRWTAEQLAAFEADPNFTVVIDRGEAAPIPGVAPGHGLAGEAAFLQGLSGVFNTFLEQLDARLERLFGRADTYRAEISEGYAAPLSRRHEDFLHAPNAEAFAATGVVQPSDVAPGADVSDAVQDNGAGPAINDLGAKSDGVGPSAAIGTAEGVRAPIFDDARIQAIRVALKAFEPGADFTGVPGRANRKKLREALGFDPSAAEIAEARVEAIAPEATLTT